MLLKSVNKSRSIDLNIKNENLEELKKLLFIVSSDDDLKSIENILNEKINKVIKEFILSQIWKNIKEVKADEFDLKLINEIKNDKECMEFQND